MHVHDDIGLPEKRPDIANPFSGGERTGSAREMLDNGASKSSQVIYSAKTLDIVVG